MEKGKLAAVREEGRNEVLVCSEEFGSNKGDLIMTSKEMSRRARLSLTTQHSSLLHESTYIVQS